MNSDKRPRPQLYLTATPLPVPAQLKFSISQLPQFFAAQWIVPQGTPAWTKLMTLKGSHRHNVDLKLLSNLPRDKAAAHFKLLPYSHPQQS